MIREHFPGIRLTTDGTGKVFVQDSLFDPLLSPGDEVLAIDGVCVGLLLADVNALVKICCPIRKKRALTIARQATGERNEISLHKVKGTVRVAALPAA